MDEEFEWVKKFFIKKKDDFAYTISSTVTKSFWLFLVLAVAILTSLIAWAFLGDIPITISGRGLIVPEKGLSLLQIPFSGKIKEVAVKPGDVVKKGDLLVQGQESASKLVSPSSGRILELFVKPDQLVKESQEAIWIENYTEEGNPGPLKIVGYFSVESGKKLRLNTPVSITVPSVNPNIYGELSGKIIKVSPFVESEANVFSEIQNHSLVSHLMNGSSAVIKVLVELDYDAPYDPNGPADYSWTSGIDPESGSVKTGSVVGLEAAIESIRPIYYVLPNERFKSYKGDRDGI